MELTQSPSQIHYSLNCPDIIVEEVVDAIKFTLKKNTTELISEFYYPYEGQVVISISDMIEAYADVAPAYDYESAPLSLFEFTLQDGDDEDTESGCFYCVKGGNNAITNDVEFFKSHWMTLQPQEINVLPSTPCLLSLVTTETMSIKLRVRYLSGSVSLQTIWSNLSPNKIYTVSARLEDFTDFCSIEGVASYEIYAQGGTVNIAPAIFVLREESRDRDTFMWQNSLGGYDVAELCAPRTDKQSYSATQVLRDKLISDHSIEVQHSITKSTGYLSTRAQVIWLQDFFTSPQKYHLHDGRVDPITITEVDGEYTRGKLGAFTFTFNYCDINNYSIL